MSAAEMNLSKLATNLLAFYVLGLDQRFRVQML